MKKYPCWNCKYCKEGKIDRTDEVSSTLCTHNKEKKILSSHNLVEERPEWCPLRKGD